MLRNERNKIRVRLLENNLSQTWLINRLESVGIFTDKSELSSALAGRRRGDKVELVLKKSIELLADYEEKMGVNNSHE